MPLLLLKSNKISSALPLYSTLSLSRSLLIKFTTLEIRFFHSVNALDDPNKREGEKKKEKGKQTNLSQYFPTDIINNFINPVEKIARGAGRTRFNLAAAAQILAPLSLKDAIYNFIKAEVIGKRCPKTANKSAVDSFGKVEKKVSYR